MEVTITLIDAGHDIELTLVDVWHKENYWKTSSNAIGHFKTGALKINKGHRRAVLWDGAGVALFELDNFDFPPYHLTDQPVLGPAFFNVKGQPLRYGSMRWLHHKEDTKD